ncbi:MAG: hypothetical protein EPO29_08365 [Betaproteobacteria bacterium]|nr:MAG: hypothetical protein EPO29_08365 [Betaproteobacteria bacterium]
MSQPKFFPGSKARIAVGAALLALLPFSTQAQQPAASAFERLKGLAGEWIDSDGAFGMKDQVAVTYRVTGAGSAVVETLFAGTPHEMVTVYHRDGSDLVLTHYCAAGNQPRMRARAIEGNRVTFRFDGGSNLDAAKDGHMHDGWIEFISDSELRAQWNGWSKGKPSEHSPRFQLTRKRS